MATLEELVENITPRFGIERKITPPEMYSDEQLCEVIGKVGKSRLRGFVLDNDNRFVYLNITKWLLGVPTMECHGPDGRIVKGNLYKGLFICGATGTGKSVALDTLSAFADIVGVDFRSDGQEYKLQWKTYLSQEVTTYYSKEGSLLRFNDDKVISIQDLGSEPLETVYMGNRMNVLSSIIEYRADAQRLTLFSSNLKMYGDKLKGMYGDRVASRLPAMCNYFILGGNDRRR